MWIFFQNEYFLIIVDQMVQSSNKKVQKELLRSTSRFPKNGIKKDNKIGRYKFINKNLLSCTQKNYHKIKHVTYYK